MARRKQTRGECVFCGREMTRGGLAKHLRSCPKRLEAQAAAKGPERTLYHLQVQDAWSGDYWLHLEMRGSTTLVDLDEYLRAIWLECCGHLSGFHIGSDFYTQIFDDVLVLGIEKSMNVKVGRLFSPGMSIPYEYDFGSTTNLTIKIVDARMGKPLSRHPIFLMARNKMEPIPCMECGQPAEYYCVECLYERADGVCHLCEQHAETHECRDYGEPVLLVNSPRSGVCGYDGPAQPPY